MKTPIKALLLLSALLTLSRSSQAEIIVTMDHNDGASNTEAFHFQTVPGPRPSAALGAVFKVVDGEPDANGASVDALHDGKLPEEEDQPDANFFFQDESDGGRLLVDLGKPVLIKEVDNYSWHPSTRAPQVYKLYGSDGGGAGFVAEPKRPQDPAQGGWKLLATVDTRTRFGNAGGQYGVKVADPSAPLGNYRYLLFDVTRTEGDEPFGNTFFSEIDVAGAAWMGGAVTPVSKVLRTQLSLEPDSGLALTDVLPDGSAAKAGLQVDDVLTRFNDQLLVSPSQLVSLVGAQQPGSTVRLSYVRRAQPGVAEVMVGTDSHLAGDHPVAANGKVTITIDRNEGAAATGAFQFKTVPSPRPSAAQAAVLATSGDVDPSSASVEAVHDGRLPDKEDQPDANFFFKADNKMSRLRLDFGRAISIKEVDTYSWHPGTRAPQVYKLWGPRRCRSTKRMENNRRSGHAKSVRRCRRPVRGQGGCRRRNHRPLPFPGFRRCAHGKR